MWRRVPISALVVGGCIVCGHIVATVSCQVIAREEMG
jgi:hypothetical protein